MSDAENWRGDITDELRARQHGDLDLAAASEIERLRVEVSELRVQVSGSLSVQIIRELYRAVERWTDDRDLLSIIGSWRDTLPDEDILSLLTDYNSSPNGTILHGAH